MIASFPTQFRYAKIESLKSTFRYRVGACLQLGKSIVRGYNKEKTHPKFANPLLHKKLSIHAELDCISKLEDASGATLYVYRETRVGLPGLAKPCEHCMKFLRDAGIRDVYYSTATYPFWAHEIL